MSVIQADQIQKPGGATFTLPIVAPINDQFLQTDGQGNLSFQQPTLPVPGITSLVAPEGVGSVGSIITHTDRQNIYSTGEWGSSSSWTTWSATQNHVDNSAIQYLNMQFGDGYAFSGTSQYMQGADAENELPRRLQFANGNRMGFSRDVFHYDNSTGNAGHSLRMMPLRNTTSTSASVTVSGYCSSYYESGYDGAQLFYFTPNTSTYSTVTSVTGTSVANFQSNTRQTNLTGSVTIPANTTILVCLVSTDWYETTYRFKDHNFFYNLNNVFTPTNGVICDMRMLSHIAKSRMTGMGYTGGFASQASAIWTTCANIYGDR
jgi:hypothetical protein